MLLFSLLFMILIPLWQEDKEEYSENKRKVNLHSLFVSQNHGAMTNPPAPAVEAAQAESVQSSTRGSIFSPLTPMWHSCIPALRVLPEPPFRT
jgi:hypothetical protein